MQISTFTFNPIDLVFEVLSPLDSRSSCCLTLILCSILILKSSELRDPSNFDRGLYLFRWVFSPDGFFTNVFFRSGRHIIPVVFFFLLSFALFFAVL